MWWLSSLSYGGSRQGASLELGLLPRARRGLFLVAVLVALHGRRLEAASVWRDCRICTQLLWPSYIQALVDGCRRILARWDLYCHREPARQLTLGRGAAAIVSWGNVFCVAQRRFLPVGREVAHANSGLDLEHD